MLAIGVISVGAALHVDVIMRLGAYSLLAVAACLPYNLVAFYLLRCPKCGDRFYKLAGGRYSGFAPETLAKVRPLVWLRRYDCSCCGLRLIVE